MFLTLMVIGLIGLVMMALPALGGHHLPPAHGHGHLMDAASHAGPPTVGQATANNTVALAAVAHPGRRFLPSPRALFSVLALYGACGNALVRAGHLPVGLAALIAVAPALLLEVVLIRPVWNLMFRYQGAASSPLEALVLADAQAVVPFRNGRGLIATVRDGRRVQLHAHLSESDVAVPVAVGQRLRIEDVDARRELVTVSVVRLGASADGRGGMRET